MKKKFLAILSAAMMFSVMGAGSAGAAPAKAVPSESHITLKSGSVNVYDYGGNYRYRKRQSTACRC